MPDEVQVQFSRRTSARAIAKNFDVFPHEPPQNHGTAVAGTIVEHAQLIGAASAARILAARAFGSKPGDARATTLNVLKASIGWRTMVLASSI